jgi:soluble cytochrome b562
MHLPRLRTFALLLALAPLANPALSSTEPNGKPAALHASMERIDEAYKSLRKILRTPETAAPADALAAITILKTEATRSRELVPETVTALPETERETALKAYREMMDTLVKTIGELELAVKAGDWTKAGEIARTMQRQKSEGHERFKAE